VLVLAFVVLAGAVAPGWAVVAVLGAAGLAGWWFVEQRQERRAAAEDARLLARAQQQVAEQAQALVAAAGQAQDAAGEASGLRDQLRSKLAALAG
jgi:acetyl-CoA carboxylase carboxyltransferase component